MTIALLLRSALIRRAPVSPRRPVETLLSARLSAAATPAASALVIL